MHHPSDHHKSSEIDQFEDNSKNFTGADTKNNDSLPALDSVEFYAIVVASVFVTVTLSCMIYCFLCRKDPLAKHRKRLAPELGKARPMIRKKTETMDPNTEEGETKPTDDAKSDDPKLVVESTEKTCEKPVDYAEIQIDAKETDDNKHKENDHEQEITSCKEVQKEVTYAEIDIR